MYASENLITAGLRAIVEEFLVSSDYAKISNDVFEMYVDSINPNFHHKASGYKVSWYNHIGSDMKFNLIDNLQWLEIVSECIRSMRK